MITSHFSPQVVDSLIRTAADLWVAGGDPHGVLSARQRLDVERVQQLLAVEGVPATADPRAQDSAAFVVIPSNPVPVAVDEAVLARWVTAAQEDDVWAWIPSCHSEGASSELSALVDNALGAAALTIDPRLELLIDTCTTAPAGFTLLLCNRQGLQKQVAVTTGYTDICYPDQDLALIDIARHHLAQVCGIANRLLGLIADPR